MFENKRFNKFYFITILLIIIWSNLFYKVFLSSGLIFDLKLYDVLVRHFYKPKKTHLISYVLITDQTYKKLFKGNSINRSEIAKLINLLNNEFGVKQIIFDIIFAYPSTAKNDENLVKSIKKFKNIIQPILIHSENYDSDFIPTLDSINIDPKLISSISWESNDIVPFTIFLSNYNILGHINDFSDNDGVYRHTKLFIRKDSLYVPSLSFAAYINLKSNASTSTLKLKDNYYLINDLKIPVDDDGNTLIPYISFWGDDFEGISLEDVLTLAEDKYKRNNLKNFFSGKIVLIADVSSSSADIYPTPFSDLSPLVMIHSSMINALLNGNFIKKINVKITLLFLNILLLISLYSLYKRSRIILLLNFIIAVFLLLVLTIFLIIVGYFFNSVSIFINLLMSFILGFLYLEFVSLKEKKIIEIDNYQKTFEMNETRKILENFIPQKKLIFNDFEICASISTAEVVGGDFFDYYINDNELRFFLADGSGHGLQAGVLVVSLKTMLISLDIFQKPSKTLSSINETLNKIHFNKLFLCMAIFGLKNSVIYFANAGLPPIFHYVAKENLIRTYRHKNIPLGIKSDFKFEESTIEIQPNDILLTFSDGLNELFDENKQMLGFENISNTLINSASSSAEGIISRFEDLIQKWKKNQIQNDDISIIVIKRILKK